MDNTEKSRRRRAKAKAQGAVRINVELRGQLAEDWEAIAHSSGGATAALAHLIESYRRRSLTQSDVLNWIRLHTR